MKFSDQKHLFSRIGYGYTPALYKDFGGYSVSETVNLLLKRETGSPFDDDTPKFKKLSKKEKKARKAQRKMNKGYLTKMAKNWLDLMSSPEYGPSEKLVFFWHDHFASWNIIAKPVKLQHETFRRLAGSNFKEMLHAISKDPLMLLFLNNQQNLVNSPNENFARELFELFTLGRGNYSENDIREAARCFTGWKTTLNGKFRLVKRQHDFGEKTIFGQTGNFEGEDVVDMVLSNKKTAKNIANKFIDYYLSDTAPDSYRNEMADYFYEIDYDIKDFLYTLFTSQEFYKEKYRGTKFKSPIEFMAGMGLHMEMQWGDSFAVVYLMNIFNQLLFFPPNVSGWPQNKQWINSSSLLYRSLIPRQLAKGKFELPEMSQEFDSENMISNYFKKRFERVGTPTATQWETHTNSNSSLWYEELSEYLLIRQPSSEIISYAKSEIEKSQSILHSVSTIMSLPEYQLA